MAFDQTTRAEPSGAVDYLTEALATPLPPSAEELASWGVAPAEPPGWIDQFIRRLARRAAIKEGLVEATPFDDPGPVYMNLDHLPDPESQVEELRPDPASQDWKELVRVYEWGCDYNATFMRSVRALSGEDFERFVAEIDKGGREIPF